MTKKRKKTNNIKKSNNAIEKSKINMHSNLFNIFIAVFVLIQPLLDVYKFFCPGQVQIFNISIIEIINFSLIFAICVITIINNT